MSEPSAEDMARDLAALAGRLERERVQVEAWTGPMRDGHLFSRHGPGEGRKQCSDFLDELAAARRATHAEAEVARLQRLVGKAADAISAAQDVLDGAEDAESAAGLLDIIQRARAALEGKG
jgi:hypothetical protein